MEEQLSDKEFERLLKENADRYRMYPSEKVWKNVHAALHSDKRRFGYTGSVLLISAILILSTIAYFNQPDNNTTKGISENNTSSSSTTLSNTISTRDKYFQEENMVAIQLPVDNRNKKLFNKHHFVLSPVLIENHTEKIDETTLAIRAESFLPDNNDLQPIENEKLSGIISLVNESASQKDYQSVVVNSNEKNISDKPVMDEEIQKKIAETIALASMNIPLKPMNKPHRFSTKFYLTPTVSYRRLTNEQNIAYRYSGWQAVPSNNVNKMVTHKPAAGLDFGIETRYRLSQRFSIKAGLQFNIDHYDIQAYYHPYEIATVAVNSGYRVDSIAAISDYRNGSGGSFTKWLENKYFQVAFPVGADMLVTKSKNINWGFSGSVLPTYLIGDGAYLISSNYKNYAKFPDLMRNWNVNLEGGTYIAYATGGVKWQVGPNARYQLLSSYVKGYPVREHLFAFGFKVGASFQKK